MMNSKGDAGAKRTQCIAQVAHERCGALPDGRRIGVILNTSAAWANATNLGSYVRRLLARRVKR